MPARSEHKPSRDSSVVEELLSRSRRFLAGMVADYVKLSLDELLQWILGRAVRYAFSTSLFIMAAGFLLLGGAEGLIVSGVPRYLAHLAIGATSLIAGFVALKCYYRPSGRE
jgi:ABC-type Co2+ transport system permease subunit